MPFGRLAFPGARRSSPCGIGRGLLRWHGAGFNSREISEMLFRLAAFSAILTFTCAAQGAGRVVILGFDGVEPTIVESMMEAGELPHLSALLDQGSYTKL